MLKTKKQKGKPQSIARTRGKQTAGLPIDYLLFTRFPGKVQYIPRGATPVSQSQPSSGSVFSGTGSSPQPTRQ